MLESIQNLKALKRKMYKKDFDILLQKKIPQAVLFYGEGEFYINFYTKKILGQLPDVNISTFYFSDYNLGYVADILGQGSLFGGNNAVVLKLDSKLSKKDIEVLHECLISNPDNFLIINFFQSESKTPSQYAQDFRSFATAFRNDRCIDVQFFTPTFYESVALLKQRAQELQIDIADFLLQNLLQMQNNDVALAMSELEKYQIFDEKISSEMIQKLSYGLGSVSIDDFINSLFESSAYLQVFEKLQEEGVEEMDILRELERYFYILFLFCIFIKINGRCDAKEVLGYQPPSFVVDKYVNRAIKLKEKQYQRIFEFLRNWRNCLMRGEKDMGVGCLIKLKAIL